MINDKSPSRKAGELDNRGSHYYLAMYWAQELAAQKEDKDLQAKFSTLAKSLTENEKKILKIPKFDLIIDCCAEAAVEVSKNDFDRVINTNLIGTINILKKF